jgi:hypothetical protein
MSDNACQTRQAQQMFRRTPKNRFSRSSTSKSDSVVRRDSPFNRPHPSPRLAEMGVRSAHARARAGHARAPRTDTGQGPNVWYVVVCSVCSGGAARRARPRRPRAGLAGPASGRGGKGRSAFRLLTRPGFVNCDTLCFVNCGATASAPSLQMEMNLLSTRQLQKNTIISTTRSHELIQ